jgi:hypothetical protein
LNGTVSGFHSGGWIGNASIRRCTGDFPSADGERDRSPFESHAPARQERSGQGYWYLDTDGNGAWDGCSIDACLGPFGVSGDLPVVGQW